QTGRLLAAACNARRLGRLAAQAEAWLPDLEATGELPGIDDATWLSSDEQAALQAAPPPPRARCHEVARLARPAVAGPRRPAPGQRGQGAGRLPVLRLDRRLCGPPVPGPGHHPARDLVCRGVRPARTRAAGAAGGR